MTNIFFFVKTISRNDFFNRGKGHTLAVMHVGAPCCGMNAAARSFVRTCISGGHRPLGIQSGVEGK